MLVIIKDILVANYWKLVQLGKLLSSKKLFSLYSLAEGQNLWFAEQRIAVFAYPIQPVEDRFVELSLTLYVEERAALGDTVMR